MITKSQIQELSSLFQIDKFSVFREYLQLLFLSYLYQEKGSGEIFFKGGTAIRLLFGSPRFSEDLDFSTTLRDEQIDKILRRLEEKISKEILGVKIVSIYSGKDGSRFRMSIKLADFKYTFNIRLDFHRIELIKNPEASTLATQFPILIFPQIMHLSAKEILKEKFEALETRCKGRDIFDVWFLLSRKIQMPEKGLDKKKIMKNLENFSQRQLSRDLGKFLPQSQKAIIPVLKKEVVDRFKKV